MHNTKVCNSKLDKHQTHLQLSNYLVLSFLHVNVSTSLRAWTHVQSCHLIQKSCHPRLSFVCRYKGSSGSLCPTAKREGTSTAPLLFFFFLNPSSCYEVNDLSCSASLHHLPNPECVQPDEGLRLFDLPTESIVFIPVVPRLKFLLICHEFSFLSYSTYILKLQ